MKRFLKKSFFIISFTLLYTTVNGQYTLVWADEFNNDGPPNPANWTSEIGFVRNHEQQWFQGANAYCKDGKLIIEARREKIKNPKHVPNSDNWKKKS